jgi:DNA mismatch repair protein MLH1
VGKELLYVTARAPAKKAQRSKDVKGKGKGKGKETDDDMETDEVSSVDEEINSEILSGDGDWKAQSYITGLNYHAKKMTFLLFINSEVLLFSR